MRDTRTACPILMCDTWKLCRILCRFQICSQKCQFLDSKKVFFLPYAIGDLYGHYAEPPKDQACQVSSLWHNLLWFGGTKSHQRTRSYELTLMLVRRFLGIIDDL